MLRNAVGVGGGVGGCQISRGKALRRCTMGYVGVVGCQFSGKKCYVTLECPHTSEVTISKN